MKINAIGQTYKPQFRANNDFHVFGYDDEESQIKRDYIREWHDKQYMPYQSIYEKEGRKSEFELKLMINDLVQKPLKINNEKIFELDLQNLRKLQNSIYRGAMVAPDELENVGKLHEAGIRTIIPIGSGYSELKDECEKFGIEYKPIKFQNDCCDAFVNIKKVQRNSEEYARIILKYDEKDIARYVKNGISAWNENSRKYINNFTDYIRTMQKGNVYMGCEYGRYHTDTAVMFDYLFNPKMKHSSGWNRFNNYFVDYAVNLYHNLTDADKIKMNWPKNFDKVFLERLSKLKK